MTKRILLSISAMMCLLMMAAGCAVDYRDRAVEKAREFALENKKDMTELQRNYVRYNDPVIMTSMIHENEIRKFMPTDHIVTRSDANIFKSPSRDWMQQCIVWDVPGLEGQLVVVGTGQRNYHYWSADRVVVRNYVPKNAARDLAVSKARLMILDGFPELEGHDRSVVRFAEPEIFITTFPVEERDSASGNLKTAKDWMAYLEKAAESVNPTQVSFVWRGEKELYLTYGISSDGTLDLWTPLKTLRISEDVLKEHTLKNDADEEAKP